MMQTAQKDALTQAEMGLLVFTSNRLQKCGPGCGANPQARSNSRGTIADGVCGRILWSIAVDNSPIVHLTRSVQARPMPGTYLIAPIPSLFGVAAVIP
jgi:hypothetical protein